MNRLPENVTNKFNELFAVISQASDDLRIATAEASMAGDFALVTANIENCKQLQALEMNIRANLNNFGNKANVSSPEQAFRRHSNSKRRTRHSGSRLRVRIDGKVIEQGTIAETFVESLKVIGLDKVAKLNKTVTAVPLVDTKPVNGYQKQRRCDGWFITTHVNKISAKTILEEIGKDLNMPVKIELIER